MLSARGASRNSLEWVTLHLPGIYLVVALIVCTSLCVLTPPFDVPDESGHARRAIQIAHGVIVAEKTTEGVGGPTDTNFLAVATAMDGMREHFAALHQAEKKLPDGRVTGEQLAPLQSLRWSHHAVFSRFQNVAVYSPVLYLPQAIGWRVGETANLTIIHSLMLSRVFAAWCAIAFGWFALRLCLTGRWLLFVYLLIPTELNLMSSCSQDALLMPLAALTGVLLWRAVEARRVLTPAEMWVTASLLAVCIIARVPYLPMVLVLPLPAFEVEGLGWKKLLPGTLGVAWVVGLVGCWQLTVHHLGTFVGPHAAPALQVLFLRTKPLSAIGSLGQAVFQQLPSLVTRGLYLLGFNDVSPPHAVKLTLVASAGALITLNLRGGVRSWSGRLALGAALSGTVLAIWLAEYLIWTMPGAAEVSGLQTRYFLPLLPFAFLLFPKSLAKLVERRVAALRPVLGTVVLAASGIFVATVLFAPLAASQAFYGTGLLQAFALAMR